MDFSKQLNEYINQLGCSSKELAEASDLSPTVISRYRNGERTPNIRSKQLEALTTGLHQMFLNKNINVDKDTIYNTLSSSLNDINIDLEQLVKNFNELVSVLKISMAELSRKTSFDASFLSRLRTGNMLPSKPQIFIDEACDFVVNKYNTPSQLKAIASLTNSNIEDLNNKYFEILKNWLSTNVSPSHDYINDFLTHLD